MPSRRVFTNGWVFWLARHPTYGLVLFDQADQVDISSGNVRIFEMKDKTRRVLSQEVLKSETSSVITDSDFVQIVTAYNALKSSLGKPLKASGYDANASIEDKHKRFLRERGLSDGGVRPVIERRLHRVTYCWSCQEHLDNSVDVECARCGWIICRCGACDPNCGR